MLTINCCCVFEVTKVRCMKCEVWGHSHTDKNCPKYGKAKDSEEPILQVRLRGFMLEIFIIRQWSWV